MTEPNQRNHLDPNSTSNTNTTSIINSQNINPSITNQYFDKQSTFPIHNPIYQPSAWAGYDTKSIFKRSLTGLNSEFSFS